MSIAHTVVINAAGTGSRLGLNLPKALIEIGGKSLISRQLEQLKDVENVTVVVGFRGRELVDHIWDVRRDVKVVINHRYLETGTAGSFVLGARTATNRVISLDADLLVKTDDLLSFIKKDKDSVALTKRKSELPVLVKVKNNMAIDMGFDVVSNLEWTGLLNIEKSKTQCLGDSHVFEGLRHYLPLNVILVDCFEIDEPQDIEKAEKWLKNLLMSKQQH